MKPYGALPVPHVTPELLSLVTNGQVYSLSVVYSEGIPVPGPMVPYTLTPRLRHGDLRNKRSVSSSASEAITMAAHTGTHIDALCHIGEKQNQDGDPDPDGRVMLYGGVPADTHITYQGQTYLSIADMPPIVTRAVLLDVAKFKGLDVLPDSYTITPRDIEGTLQSQETQVQPGSAVLLRTGFYKHLRDGNPAYTDAIAGLGLDGAKLLAERGMILAGADNMTVEPMPPYDHAVHRFLLVHNGITHLENLYLEALAAAQAYEFLLIVTPLKLSGSTGSWVHPIAIT